MGLQLCYSLKFHPLPVSILFVVLIAAEIAFNFAFPASLFRITLPTHRSHKLNLKFYETDAVDLAGLFPTITVTHNLPAVLEAHHVLNYSRIVIEMRRRQETGFPTRAVEPAPSQCSNPLPLPAAFNLGDQHGLYSHHGVFSCVVARGFPFKKEYILDLGGLYVPAEYDCRNLVPGGKIWGSYDFFTPIPDRWTRCVDHQYLIMKGVKDGEFYEPLLPVIDEEYVERAAVYQVVLNANSRRQREFVVVDLGARWGTWAARAISALREYNPMPYRVYMVEVNPEHCRGAEKVIELNMLENVTLWCGYWDLPHFTAFVNSVDQIDVLDLDCDGCEKTVLPQLAGLLEAKAKRVIVACHWENCHLGFPGSWRSTVFPATAWRSVDGYGIGDFQCSAKTLFSGNFDSVRECKLMNDGIPSLGLFSHNDGALVMDNTKLFNYLPIYPNYLGATEDDSKTRNRNIVH